MTRLSLDDRAIVNAARAIKSKARKEAKAERVARVIPAAEGQRRVRINDKPFLAFVRHQPCAVRIEPHCLGCSGPIEAAHIRTSLPGEPPTGLQRKPDDRRVTPLCQGHHRQQHTMNEMRFWSSHGRDPFQIAADLYQTFINAG